MMTQDSPTQDSPIQDSPIQDSPIPTESLPDSTQLPIELEKSPLQQLQDAIDPRKIAGGLVGLVTGEAIGGAIGGVVGSVFGPPGVVTGAAIGAFTGSMIGQKVGSDTIADLVNLQAMSSPSIDALPQASARAEQVGQFLGQRMSERAGEVVGIAAGSTVGMAMAGPIGGAIGATLGSTFGGQVGADFAPSSPAAPAPEPTSAQSSAVWLQKFGTTTLGETSTTVVGSAVGTAFLGVPGKRLGERIGAIVGRRIDWHALAFQSSPPAVSDAALSNSLYSIAHRTTGYIRFKIPQLSGNATAAEQLQEFVEAWVGVLETRLNVAARSIAIHYDSAQLSADSIEQNIKTVLARF